MSHNKSSDNISSHNNGSHKANDAGSERVETQPGETSVEQKRRARRNFLKATGALLISAGVGAGRETQTSSTSNAAPPLTAPQPPVPAAARFPERVAGQYPQVPYTPTEPPLAGVLYFFTLHEAHTVEDLTARIFPGTPDDPGAREAGVVNYIDFLLSHEHGFAQAVYRRPPFAEPYRGSGPPDRAGELGSQVIWVPWDELSRYGYQSSLTPREIYRRGIEAVDRYARSQYGAPHIELTEEQQDSVVGTMADGKVTGTESQLGSGQSQTQGQPQGAQGGGEETGYYPPSLEDFFQVLRSHTIEGMFADPLYGGNRDLAGWRLLRYPGAQRAYTPREVVTEGSDKLPQSIADLPHFNAGRHANDGVILPVSGSDQKHQR